MMDNEKIIENLKLKISISNFEEEEYMNKSKTIVPVWKSLAVACCMIISLSGMVFSKEISTKLYENFFGTGNGIETAMNEGYIEDVNMENQVSNSVIENEETGEIIEDTQTSIKVNEFIMDDFSLSMTFEVTLSDKINEIIETEKIWDMNFPDLIIYDENNIILYNGYGANLDEFCNEKKLEYDSKSIPDDKLFGSGINSYIKEKEGNKVEVIFNIYTGGDSIYPKSKKINIDANRIRISDEVEGREGYENIVIKGEWNFSVDVPEKMYNRSNIIYVQKSTTNEEFNVTSAVLYDTGMDISLKFKTNEEKLKMPTTPELEFYKTLPKDDELVSLEMSNFLYRKLFAMPEYQEYAEKSLEVWEFEKYLTNENGEKFELTVGPRENGSASIDEEGYMNFNGMFDLTKYDQTDTITVHIDYHGTTADIVLEKVGE